MMLAITLIFVPAVCLSAADVTVSAARRDETGILIHTVESPYQPGRTQIRVLLPEKIEAGRRFPVVYVLPVEAGREDRYGDGLLEVQKQELHKKHAAIFVSPTFSQLPWYADHPTNPEIRQETHFLKVVLPFVEKEYPALAEPAGRLLLGFSKSGWGAWSLLLRHDELFGRAAAWDAPLLMDRLGKYGTTGIIGTQENFEKYRIADLLRGNPQEPGGEPRLILSGYHSFREHHEKAHALLTERKIPHEYRDTASPKHDWHSGWVPVTVELLLRQPTGPDRGQ
jgi:S-formylglutathione hydrolase FrmB